MNVTGPRETVIERIRKLLALAESDNPHEAALAVSRAQSLMERYAVEATEIGEAGDEELGEDTLANEPHDRTRLWRLALSGVLARHTGCAVYGDGRTRIQAIGRPSDVAILRELYAYYAREIETQTPRHCAGRGRAAFHAFRLGMVSGVEFALRDERRRTQADLRAHLDYSIRALTVVDTRASEARAWLSAHVSGLRGRRGSFSDSGAFASGVDAGRSAHSRSKPRLRS